MTAWGPTGGFVRGTLSLRIGPLTQNRRTGTRIWDFPPTELAIPDSTTARSVRGQHGSGDSPFPGAPQSEAEHPHPGPVRPPRQGSPMADFVRRPFEN